MRLERATVRLGCAALACALAWAAAVLSGASAAAPVREVRALWVARTTLVSPAAITRMIQAAKASGFNTLLVQIRARGDAYYSGGLEPRAEALAAQSPAFDPLQLTVAEGHRAGLQVHAWIAVNLVSPAAELPASRAHVIYRHPEWLMVSCSVAPSMRGMRPASRAYLDTLVHASRKMSAEVEGLFVSPIDPAAVDYLARVVGDITARYRIDGVHLDYVRYPTDDFDCSPRALSLFAAAMNRSLKPAEVRVLRGRTTTDPLVYVQRYPERWREFRQARLTALVERLRAVVKARRPGALLSAAVIPDADEASERRLQDWRRWAEAGLIDVVCPMAYATESGAFTAQLSAASAAAGDVPLWAGIGAYRLSPAQTVENIQIARRLGADGVVLFSYDSLVGSPPNADALSRIGRAAFGHP